MRFERHWHNLKSTPARAPLRPAFALIGVCLLAACAAQPPAEPPTVRPSGAATPLTSEEYAWLDRVTWGVDDSAAREFRTLGMESYLDRQLHPEPATLPPAVAAMLADNATGQESLASLVMRLDDQRKAAVTIAKDDEKKTAQRSYQDALTRVARDSATRSLLRDLYSPNQLQEQMTWFWFNHFNVCQCKRNLRAMVGDYEERAIRPYALGSFRDLVRATMRHPAMIRYLDNEQNAAGRINENYARELMELHTLGVNGGYTQKDVQELARVLTGLGINQTDKTPNVRPALRSQYFRDGLTEFNPNRHDYGDKILLGQTVHGEGLAEIDAVADMLSRQPATARFISRKLAIYFVADDPPESLVDRMAITFQQSDGDIAATLSTMFRSREFSASLGSKFKDPMHYVVSAVRLAYDDRPIRNAAPMMRWVDRMGEPLYRHLTPDGYPMTQAAWASPGQLVVRFEVARIVGASGAGLFKADAPDAPAEPAFPRLANSLYYATTATALDPATRAALAQSTTPQEWNALLLSSPEFMNR